MQDIGILYDKWVLDQAGGNRVAASTHASQLGGPCLRRLCYDRLLPTPPPELGLARIFARGKALEEVTRIELTQALQGTGIEIACQRDSIPPNPYEIGAVLDWWLVFTENGRVAKRIPCEFKTCAPWVWKSIETFKDMREHSSSYVRKWAGQLTVYMLLTNKEEGVFLLRDVQSYAIKQVHAPLDLEYGEELLSRAERVRDVVHKVKDLAPEKWDKFLPARLSPYDPAECDKCPHRSVCIPDLDQAPGVMIKTDTEFDTLCRMALNPLAERGISCEEWREAIDASEQAAKKLADMLKHMAEGHSCGEKLVVASRNYRVVASIYEYTAYDVPQEVKKEYATKRIGIRKSISTAEGGEE